MPAPSEYGQLLTIAASGALQALEGANAIRRQEPEQATVLAEIGQGYALLAQAAAQAVTAEAQALTAEAIAASRN